MNKESQSEEYNLEEARDAVNSLQRISNKYDLEDLALEDEREAVEEAAGAIRTFYDVSQELRDVRDQNYEEGSENSTYNLGVRTGQLWPEAYRAKEAMQEVAKSGEITDKILYSALNKVGQEDSLDTAPGINSSRHEDTVDRATDVLTDIDELSRLYAKGDANARTASQFMLLDGEEGNPIDVARDVAGDEGYDEFVEYIDEIQSEFHETEEEMNQEIKEIAEQAID